MDRRDSLSYTYQVVLNFRGECRQIYSVSTTGIYSSGGQFQIIFGFRIVHVVNVDTDKVLVVTSGELKM